MISILFLELFLSHTKSRSHEDYVCLPWGRVIGMIYLSALEPLCDIT
jgi:hypothetical protein